MAAMILISPWHFWQTVRTQSFLLPSPSLLYDHFPARSLTPSLFCPCLDRWQICKLPSFPVALQSCLLLGFLVGTRFRYPWRWSFGAPGAALAFWWFGQVPDLALKVLEVDLYRSLLVRPDRQVGRRRRWIVDENGHLGSDCYVFKNIKAAAESLDQGDSSGFGFCFW